MTTRRSGRSTIDDPLWYKDAIIYEIHVRACYDSDGDGVGDFKGLAEKLDYFADLGITALWLLPFYPSPLRDDGYDIADYTAVHPAYGALSDFKLFLDEAHARGLRVITELVLNHTSSDHPWFRRARRAKEGSAARDFYVWSQTPDRYQDARIIFKDFETSNWAWDPVAHAYYWHRFYSHQPDLNFDNPAVQRALLDVVDFWFGMGVDGLRLDAVPYLFEREGTSCENLLETHQFLQKLRTHIDERWKNRMLLAEANQWPEDAVAYFGGGEECHMAFHFPLMPRLFMGLQLEDRFPIIDILEQTPSIPADSQWALFLRNHDELTLEMVTDEDRDYMYRVYATDPRARINLGIRRRLAPLLRARRKVELMKGLLLSLPGTPVLYYGDEIGMGDNIYLGDRNGVRTPMQWSSDRNAGFSRANPQSLFLPVVIDPEYHYEAINVEAQQNNPNSLLWWHKRVLALRKRYKALSRGSFEILQPDNRKVFAFVRRWGDETILIVGNLSRFAQYVELQLPAFRGLVPHELFGNSRFPTIGETPYFLTLAPYGFYWFSLTSAPVAATVMEAAEEPLMSIEVEERWQGVLEGHLKAELEELLARYLPHRRWFRGKAKAIKEVRIEEVIGLDSDEAQACLTFLRVDYQEHEPERYLLPLGFLSGERAKKLMAEHPQMVVARLSVLPANEAAAQEGLLIDALGDPACARALLSAIAERSQLSGRSGQLSATAYAGFPTPLPPLSELEPVLGRLEQTNTSIAFGGQLILKLLRRLDPGINPELEMSLFLSERMHSARVAPLAGALAYHARRAEPVTIGVAHVFVPNQGDAWSYTVDALGRYYEQAAARPIEAVQNLSMPLGMRGLWEDAIPELALETIGAFLPQVGLLGQRTGELHATLAAEPDDAAFAPEPFTPHYQRSLFEQFRTSGQRSMRMLRAKLEGLPESARRLGRELLERENLVAESYRRLLRHRVTAKRTRCHGDYHLGQVLYTGSDFVVIDFEGEPDRTIGERRFKRSPITDIASMLRSFHYAAVFALRRQVRDEDVAALRPWADFWQAWVSARFLRSYLTAVKDAIFMPKTKDELALLLELYVMEKAFYEIGYELNNRPAWVEIPLIGLLQQLVGTHAPYR